jgi:hypothetical protein
MKTIKLTKGREAIVDDEDFEELNKYHWCVVSTGYAGRFTVTENKRKLQYMHRQIMDVSDPNIFIDHINGNGLDNRRCNLRTANRYTNLSNRQITNKNNTSGYRGVYWHKRHGYWISSIKFYNKQIHLGNFKTPEEAARAFNRKARELFGEYAGKLNEVDD